MPASPELADRAAYFPDADALVLADLHLGRDADSAVDFPMGERDRLPRRIEALLEQFEPTRVVLAGDVLHAFDDVPESVEAALAALEATVTEAGAEVVYVAGNHDTMLPAIVDAEVVEHHRIDDDTVVHHGDEAPDADAQRYVVGHEHPAIVIEGQRHPCYLDGPAAARDASVLILPAFNRLAKGTVVNGARDGDLGSPLVDRLDRFRPAVLDPEADDVLWFPPLGELRPHL